MSFKKYLHLYNKAFTLIELSIVLVIVALLIAAVIAGKSLVKASQIRSIISQINEVDTATAAFIDRYNAVPGDMANASTIFGSSSLCNTSACNGNGNNQVETETDEPLLYFLHLRLSGLIDGNYNGTGSSLPKIKIRNVPMSVRYVSDALFFGRGNQHAITIGKPYVPLRTTSWNAFTSSEVYELDIKMDDGVAYTGKIFSIFNVAGGNPYQATSSVAPGIGCSGYANAAVPSSDYELRNNTSYTCAIVYWMNSI